MDFRSTVFIGGIYWLTFFSHCPPFVIFALCFIHLSSQAIVLWLSNANVVHCTPIQLEIQVDLSNDTIFNCLNETGLFEDDSICNIYHECNCTAAGCAHVNSYICPDNQVFSMETRDCVQIETLGCHTSYFHLNDTKPVANNDELSTSSTTPENVSKIVLDEMAPMSRLRMGSNANKVEQIDHDNEQFRCPPGVNNRYADSLICNIFHVCVTKGESTYDQPFLCPYSSMFRVVNATHMYCDKKRYDNDCTGKAFYKDTNDANSKQQMLAKKLLLSATRNASLCAADGLQLFEDPTYCNAYHRCMDGIDEFYMCENQLLYNPLSTLCDYPINVDCDRKDILKRDQVLNGTTTTRQSTTLTGKRIMESVSEAKSSDSSARSQHKMATPFFIFGIKIDLNCPIDAQNLLLADAKFCNVFHHCHTTSGNVFVCDKGQAFDTSANGPNSSGVCNFEESVNCSGKFILTENGVRAGKQVNANVGRIMVAQSTHMKHVSYDNVREDLVSGIAFDCHTKPAGHWRDTRFCDIYHACINGEQKKTYKCAQMSERVYFDEQTKRYLNTFFALESNYWVKPLLVEASRFSIFYCEKLGMAG